MFGWTVLCTSQDFLSTFSVYSGKGEDENVVKHRLCLLWRGGRMVFGEGMTKGQHSKGWHYKKVKNFE